MAQANVAREPSMEEILASIRKIIESNDDPEAGDRADAMSAAQEDIPDDDRNEDEPPLTVIKAANEQEAPEATGASGGLSAFAAGAPKKPTPESLQASPSPFAPPSYSGEAGTSRHGAGAADATEKPVSLARFAAEAESTSKAAIEEDAEEKSDDGVIEIAAEAKSGNKVRPDLVSGKPEADVLHVPGKPGPDIDADRSDDPMATPMENDLSDGEEARALISPEAGAKVAASFDNLNHALVSGPNRSFDEIAEDMLRPMLQQWLDDNLPTLVERLVREEIERVARGR
ncbi:DUF2497 domain-containing protein [Hoeflea sp. TYP-13]|uniref:DUF2497 domain-containing protein n=1 Tax=Hoeflea sp. TYP-13 TaxID=3230023 RepID=UPI0034C6DD38